jgi:thioredoxin 1
MEALMYSQFFFQEVSSEWQVQAMPTFVIVKDGKEVTRIVGAKKDELERKIQMFSS